MWKLLTFSLLVSTRLDASQPPNSRIIGGNAVNITDYPYAVQIEYYELFCGGVLVAPQWVLTVGTCTFFKDLDKFIIRVGTTATGDGGQVFNISSEVLHPQFIWDQIEYNVVLLRLNGTITGPNAQIVEMVEEGSSIPVGSNITFVGWGWVTEGYLQYDQNFATSLQVVELPILDNETCNKTNSQFNSTTDTMFCAGYLDGGQGVGFGDIGGPAMYQGKLIGLASWTDNCTCANRPGVFTRVSYIKTWVNDTIST